MKISEVRDWATETFGAHSHQEGQILAALGPLEEWLGHLARHGVQLELSPTGAGTLAKPAKDEPPSPLNSGGTSGVFEVPVPAVEGTPPSPTPDPATFVQEPSEPTSQEEPH